MSDVKQRYYWRTQTRPRNKCQGRLDFKIVYEISGFYGKDHESCFRLGCGTVWFGIILYWSVRETCCLRYQNKVLMGAEASSGTHLLV